MISVIVPAYNAADTIGVCLESLGRQTVKRSGYELLVVDDGSTDQTAAVAMARGARVIRTARGRPAAARNAGVAAATGDIVCFTDADCEPLPDWLEQITAPLRADAAVAACKGVYRTRQRQLVARFVQIEYEEKYDRLRSQHNIDFIDTYSAAFRRDVLVANNGFDERFPYAEDRELAYRLSARGYPLLFQPEAAVYHRHSDTLWRYCRKKVLIGYWVSQILRRFPGQSVRDSHTPQVMKLQILLVSFIGLGVGAALAATIAGRHPWPFLLPAGLLLAWLATTVPFIGRAWQRDRPVAIVAPILLFARALALGLGYAGGLLAPRAGMSGAEDTIGGLAYMGKRLLDVVGALIGLGLTILLSPIWLPQLRQARPGPLLIRRLHVGQGGQIFELLSFPCQHPGPTPDSRLARLYHRWGLERLPQFWNVLRGDLSLVGPRPETPATVAAYSDWHRRPLAVKPGLTGPVQLQIGPDLGLDRRVQLDLAYIGQYSWRRDLVLLVRAVVALARAAGEPPRLPS